MIPATHPYRARFKHEIKDKDGNAKAIYEYLPVVAWDEDGEPMVSNDKRLVPANWFTNFVGIEEDTERVLAALPGGGWRVAWVHGDGSEPRVEPVLAWAIDVEGDARAISVDMHGVADFVRFRKDVAYLLPPRTDAQAQP